MVERLVFLGSATQVIVRLAEGSQIQALVQNTGDHTAYAQGDAVRVHLPVDALRVLPLGHEPVVEDPALPEPTVPTTQPVA